MNSFRKLKYRGTAGKPPEKKEQKRDAKRRSRDTGGNIPGQDDGNAQEPCEK
ncbi:MAG: hypothetical protein K2I96_12260 [Lachnospiraceae bacterium]|nr:hypothetical protein [Lachnospiraceae bacterium]